MAGVPKTVPWWRRERGVLTNVNPRNVRSYEHAMRLERRNDKARLKYLGQKFARKQWLTAVHTTAIEIPEWAKLAAHKEMSQGEQYVWFRGRRLKAAKRLVAEDEAAGGQPVMTLVQWRRCKVCGRILLALEAEDRRRLDETRGGRQKPCGVECGNTEVIP